MKQEEHDVIRSGGKVLGHGGRKAWIAIGEEVFLGGVDGLSEGVQEKEQEEDDGACEVDVLLGDKHTQQEGLKQNYRDRC